MEFVNPSQSLFPSTGQLFDNVDPVASPHSPEYTQEGTGIYQLNNCKYVGFFVL